MVAAVFGCVVTSLAGRLQGCRNVSSLHPCAKPPTLRPFATPLRYAILLGLGNSPIPPWLRRSLLGRSSPRFAWACADHATSMLRMLAGQHIQAWTFAFRLVPGRLQSRATAHSSGCEHPPDARSQLARRERPRGSNPVLQSLQRATRPLPADCALS